MATATYIPIATQTLGSAASSITFSSIPSTYTDLRLVLTGHLATGYSPILQFNGDTGANYSTTFLSGNGSSANSTSTTSYNSVDLTSQNTWSQTTNSLITTDIFSYAGSTNKTCLSCASTDLNGSGAVELGVTLWRSTAAITSITVFVASSGTYAAGTTATLWGI